MRRDQLRTLRALDDLSRGRRWATLKEVADAVKRINLGTGILLDDLIEMGFARKRPGIVGEAKTAYQISHVGREVVRHPANASKLAA